MRRIIMVVSVAGWLAGCGNQPVAIQETQLAGWGAYPAAPYIQVLAAPPEAAFVPIARLTVNSAAGLDRAQALAALEQRARELGADAIVVTEESRPAAPGLTLNPSGGSYALTSPQQSANLVGEAIHVAGP